MLKITSADSLPPRTHGVGIATQRSKVVSCAARVVVIEGQTQDPDKNSGERVSPPRNGIFTDYMVCGGFSCFGEKC